MVDVVEAWLVNFSNVLRKNVDCYGGTARKIIVSLPVVEMLFVTFYSTVKFKFSYFRISKQDHDAYVASLDKEQAELEKVNSTLNPFSQKKLHSNHNHISRPWLQVLMNMQNYWQPSKLKRCYLWNI